MKLHILTPLPDEFDETAIDVGDFAQILVLEDAVSAVAMLGEGSVTLIATSDNLVDEEVLDSLADIVTTDVPDRYLLSRALPGDVALMRWDDSDTAYERLRVLNRSGVTVLDPFDDYIEVVLDKTVDVQDLVDLITRRVTADVLQTIREDGDTPSRRGKFRSRAPRA